ncbi:cupredoxin domain-containing protein [Candidatus Pacearchaeota archaeon]|nr:cupredoxin domain-containing protein [Candidatus Pacearchaeota archaeon]
MKMKKTTFYLALTFIVLLLAGSFFFNNNSRDNNLSGDAVETIEDSKEINEITLGMKNYNYYPQTINIKAGETARIYLDSSVYGCFRSFTIRELGVSRYLKTPSDYVEFALNKKGSYTFACSMGMGTGTLIVE